MPLGGIGKNISKKLLMPLKYSSDSANSIKAINGIDKSSASKVLLLVFVFELSCCIIIIKSSKK